MLRVAIDRRSTGWDRPTGIVRYRETLATDAAATGTAVGRICDAGPSGGWPWPPVRRSMADWQARDVFRRAQRRFTLTGTFTTLRLPDAPDLCHWSFLQPMRAANARNIYTVHDLVPLHHREISAVSPDRFRRMLGQAARHADAFAAVSATVRDELADWLGPGGPPVLLCRPSIDPPKGQAADLPPGLIAGGYILALGRIEPRKNIERLILAHRRSKTALPLVLAGPDGHWPDAMAARRVAAMIDGQRVIRLDWQPDPVAAALISHAAMLAMPSLAEGFGLPVIEAMAAGVPVLASPLPCIADAPPGAVVLVDPLSIDAIADGIDRLDGDAALRHSVAAGGMQFARGYSRASHGDALRSLYQSLVSSFSLIGDARCV